MAAIAVTTLSIIKPVLGAQTGGVIGDMGAALGVALLRIQVLVIPALYFALRDDGLPPGRSRHLQRLAMTDTRPTPNAADLVALQAHAAAAASAHEDVIVLRRTAQTSTYRAIDPAAACVITLPRDLYRH